MWLAVQLAVHLAVYRLLRDEWRSNRRVSGLGGFAKDRLDMWTPIFLDLSRCRQAVYERGARATCVQFCASVPFFTASPAACVRSVARRCFHHFRLHHFWNRQSFLTFQCFHGLHYRRSHERGGYGRESTRYRTDMLGILLVSFSGLARFSRPNRNIV